MKTGRCCVCPFPDCPGVSTRWLAALAVAYVAAVGSGVVFVLTLLARWPR